MPVQTDDRAISRQGLLRRLASRLLRRAAYLGAVAFGAAYAIEVLVVWALGLQARPLLGDLGEFLLVLAAIVFFVVGLLQDEAAQRPEVQNLKTIPPEDA